MTPEQMQRSARVYSCAGYFNRGFASLVKREPEKARSQLRAAVGNFVRLGDDPLLADHLRDRIFASLEGPGSDQFRDAIIEVMPLVLDACVELLCDAARYCEEVKLKDKIGNKL